MWVHICRQHLQYFQLLAYLLLHSGHVCHHTHTHALKLNHTILEFVSFVKQFSSATKLCYFTATLFTCCCTDFPLSIHNFYPNCLFNILFECAFHFCVCYIQVIAMRNASLQRLLQQGDSQVTIRSLVATLLALLFIDSTLHKLENKIVCITFVGLHSLSAFFYVCIPLFVMIFYWHLSVYHFQCYAESEAPHPHHHSMCRYVVDFCYGSLGKSNRNIHEYI